MIVGFYRFLCLLSNFCHVFSLLITFSTILVVMLMSFQPPLVSFKTLFGPFFHIFHILGNIGPFFILTLPYHKSGFNFIPIFPRFARVSFWVISRHFSTILAKQSNSIIFNFSMYSYEIEEVNIFQRARDRGKILADFAR